MEQLQAARELLQNPCAYVEDVEEEKAKIKRHSALHLSGNPYASLAEWGGDDDESIVSKDSQRLWLAEARHSPQKPLPSPQLDLNLLPAQQPSGNPYASLSESDDGAEPMSPLLIGVGHEAEATAPPKTFREFLSKADFRSECIRVFLPYVPPYLPRRIPQHQRDFIARNECRSGRARFRLVESLRRYDLSTTPSIAPQFNREHSLGLSEKKLRQIEAEVGDD